MLDKKKRKPSTIESMKILEGDSLSEFLLSSAYTFDSMDSGGVIKRILNLETQKAIGFLITTQDGQSAIVKENP
jgi:hypothetical protein